MKTFIITVSLLAITFLLKGQELNDKAKLKLQNYLIVNENKYGESINYYVIPLLNSSNNCFFWKFGIKGQHFDTFIFYKEKECISIISNYRINNILKVILNVFEDNEISEDEKIIYITEIMNIVNTKNNSSSSGWDEPSSFN